MFVFKDTLQKYISRLQNQLYNHVEKSLKKLRADLHSEIRQVATDKPVVLSTPNINNELLRRIVSLEEFFGLEFKVEGTGEDAWVEHFLRANTHNGEYNGVLASLFKDKKNK